ncbi:MAG: response regulator transcription factor [Armatimonadota bacterium]|nr:response regulator transcription factor [Armatimonadota bacterium]
MRVRVLLVDNVALFRQGIEALLRTTSDLEVVGTAGTAREALEKAGRLKPDVAVMDVAGWGVGLIREVARVSPLTKVFVLTDDDSPETASQAVEAGVVGYVLKDINAYDLMNGIRYAANGKSMVNPRLVRELLARVAVARRTTSKDIARGRGLSEREIEVLAKLGEGLCDREIAAALSVSEATVKTHLRAIYRTLGVRNRAQAAAFAVSSGLI